MNNSNKDKLLKEMDMLFYMFISCRAYFPYLTEEDIGKTEFDTATMYIEFDNPVTFKLKEVLTIENINENNELSHWLNQNFIIRLYSLLDSYNYKYPFDGKIDGYEEVNILRKLRDIFAHSSDKYDEDCEKQKTMLLEIVNHFKLEDKKPDHIPLSIDTVIKPIFDRCKIYINGKVDKN